MNQPLHAAGYVRGSTEEQVQGFSLDAQAERIKAYALSQDYSLVHIHRDDGYSAKDMNRLRRLLADVKGGSVMSFSSTSWTGSVAGCATSRRSLIWSRSMAQGSSPSPSRSRRRAHPGG